MTAEELHFRLSVFLREYPEWTDAEIIVGEDIIKAVNFKSNPVTKMDYHVVPIWTANEKMRKM